MVLMDEMKILKALANDTRRQIMTWLKEPKRYFPQAQGDADKDGICCGLIQQKAGLSQSTISYYLSILERAGLLTSKRSGQWTFYKRNEVVVQQFIAKLTAVI